MEPDSKVTIIWANHASVLLDGMRDFFLNQNLTDITLTYHTQKLRVHRLMMAVLCPQLHLPSSLSSGVLPEDDTQQQYINLDSMGTFDLLPFIVELMYCGKVTIPKTNQEDFFNATKQFGIRGLDKENNNDTLHVLATEDRTERLTTSGVIGTSLDDNSDHNPKSDVVDPAEKRQNDMGVQVELCCRSRCIDGLTKMKETTSPIVLTTAVSDMINEGALNCKNSDRKVSLQKLADAYINLALENLSDTDSDNDFHTDVSFCDESKSWHTLNESVDYVKIKQEVVSDVEVVYGAMETRSKWKERHLRQTGQMDAVNGATGKPDSTPCVRGGKRSAQSGEVNVSCRSPSARTRKCKTEPPKQELSDDDDEDDEFVNNRDWRCPLCTFVASSDTEMKKHSRSHEMGQSKLLPYACQQCNFKAQFPSRLIYHIKMRHPKSQVPAVQRQVTQKIFCDWCGTAFPSMSDFKAHQKMACLKCRRFKCTSCSIVFLLPDSIIRHQNAANHGQKILCRGCSTVLKSHEEMFRHIKTKHSEIKPQPRRK